MTHSAVPHDPVPHQAAHYAPPSAGPWSPVYEDAHLIVLDKPSGLLTVPGRGEHLQDCLIHRAQAVRPDALIVHRLDMDTSGLVVLARGAAVQRQLSMLFQSRQVDKAYEALVAGRVLADQGEVDLPLITDWPRRPRQMVDPVHGKPSQTRYRVLQRDEAGLWTRLRLEPLTGRSHQLRVHCLALGHPILGDPLYADAPSRAMSPRLCLHATALAWVHPATGERVEVHSPTPF